MGQIYIETDENFRVTKIHRMPFDPNNGMGYTREELEKKGFFVDDIPEPIHQTGRRSIAMYNPDTKTIYYESVGIPMSDKERVEQLENAMNSMMNMLFAPTTLALTEEEDTAGNGLADYLAYQIISGKMEVEDCLNKFPQFTERIKETLMDNGVQV